MVLAANHKQFTKFAKLSRYTVWDCTGDNLTLIHQFPSFTVVVVCDGSYNVSIELA